MTTQLLLLPWLLCMYTSKVSCCDEPPASVADCAGMAACCTPAVQFVTCKDKIGSDSYLPPRLRLVLAVPSQHCHPTTSHSQSDHAS